MKMTKKEIKKTLKKDYVEALAFFADYLNLFDEGAQYSKLYELDDKVWGIACEENVEQLWMTIYSALLLAID